MQSKCESKGFTPFNCISKLWISSRVSISANMSPVSFSFKAEMASSKASSCCSVIAVVFLGWKKRFRTNVLFLVIQLKNEANWVTIARNEANKILTDSRWPSKTPSKSSELHQKMNVYWALPLESSVHFLSRNGQFFYLCGLFWGGWLVKLTMWSSLLLLKKGAKHSFLQVHQNRRSENVPGI